MQHLPHVTRGRRRERGGRERRAAWRLRIRGAAAAATAAATAAARGAGWLGLDRRCRRNGGWLGRPGDLACARVLVGRCGSLHRGGRGGVARFEQLLAALPTATKNCSQNGLSSSMAGSESEECSSLVSAAVSSLWSAPPVRRTTTGEKRRTRSCLSLSPTVAAFLKAGGAPCRTSCTRWWFDPFSRPRARGGERRILVASAITRQAENGAHPGRGRRLEAGCRCRCRYRGETVGWSSTDRRRTPG